MTDLLPPHIHNADGTAHAPAKLTCGLALSPRQHPRVHGRGLRIVEHECGFGQRAGLDRAQSTGFASRHSLGFGPHHCIEDG